MQFLAVCSSLYSRVTVWPVPFLDSYLRCLWEKGKACFVGEFVAGLLLSDTMPLPGVTSHARDSLTGLTAYTHHFILTADSFCPLLSTFGDKRRGLTGFPLHKEITLLLIPMSQKPYLLLIFIDFWVAAPWEPLPHRQWYYPAFFVDVPFQIHQLSFSAPLLSSCRELLLLFLI